MLLSTVGAYKRLLLWRQHVVFCLSLSLSSAIRLHWPSASSTADFPFYFIFLLHFYSGHTLSDVTVLFSSFRSVAFHYYMFLFQQFRFFSASTTGYKNVCMYLHVTRDILYTLVQIACWFCSGQLSAEFYSKSHPPLYSFSFFFLYTRTLALSSLGRLAFFSLSVELLLRNGFSSHSSHLSLSFFSFFYSRCDSVADPVSIRTGALPYISAIQTSTNGLILHTHIIPCMNKWLKTTQCCRSWIMRRSEGRHSHSRLHPSRPRRQFSVPDVHAGTLLLDSSSTVSFFFHP